MATFMIKPLSGRFCASQLELAVVEYIAWFSNDRLHESPGDLSPVEFESLYVDHEIQLSNLS